MIDRMQDRAASRFAYRPTTFGLLWHVVFVTAALLGVLRRSMGGLLTNPPSPDKETVEERTNKIHYVCSKMRGWRVTQEDFYVAKPLQQQKGRPDCWVFGVFDGHGGHDVAEYCSVVLPQVMHHVVTDARAGEDRFAHFKREDIQYAITLADGNVWNYVQHNNYTCGTTACVMLFQEDIGPRGKLWIANLGDSRAILNSGKIERTMTQDHTVKHPLEEFRLKRDGYPLRNGYINEFHRSATRGLGDFGYKLYIDQPMISNKADIVEHELSDFNHFMVLVTRGVSECYSDEYICKFIRERLVASRATGESLSSIAEAFLDHCLASCWSAPLTRGHDNMSVVIVKFLDNLGDGY